MVPQSGQPEEEPLRRDSVRQFQLPPVHEIPVPEDNEDIFDEPPSGTDSPYNLLSNLIMNNYQRKQWGTQGKLSLNPIGRMQGLSIMRLSLSLHWKKGIASLKMIVRFGAQKIVKKIFCF